jgi:PAS domain S-box-containing protein
MPQNAQPHEAQLAAEQAALHLAAIVENSDDAILTKDLDGIITSWNRGAERLFGYNPTEIIGKPVTTLIPPHKLDEEPNILSRLKAGERIDHYETVRRRKDGSLVDISLTVSPLRNSQGVVIGKYGALKLPNGRVTVRATAELTGEQARVAVEWKETGSEIASAKPERKGFGTRVIEAAVNAERNHSTQMSFEPTGLLCRFNFTAARSDVSL